MVLPRPWEGKGRGGGERERKREKGKGKRERNDNISYSQKYWRELNLAVEPKIAIARILADLKFGGSVQDRHTYIICE